MHMSMVDLASACDLHTHSCYSDGTYTPEELVAHAKRIGLKAIALTDHNNVDGLPRFVSAAENAGIEAISGVEFSTDYNGTELHILMLGVKIEHYEKIRLVLQDFQRRKEQSNRDLIEKLNHIGIKLSYDDLCKKTVSGFVNRAVIATELMEKGYVSSVNDGFRKYLSEKSGLFVPPKRMDAFCMISFIKKLGGIAILAHPFLNLNEAGLRGFLPEAIKSGLDAIETIYSEYDAETTKAAKRIAEEFGVLQSGGSDFHGQAKPEITLGIGHGDLFVPYSFWKKLQRSL